MASPETGRTFDPQKTADSVYEGISQRALPVSRQEINETVLELASKARITQFISSLATKIALDLGRTRRNSVR